MYMMQRTNFKVEINLEKSTRNTFEHFIQKQKSNEDIYLGINSGYSAMFHDTCT